MIGAEFLEGVAVLVCAGVVFNVEVRPVGVHQVVGPFRGGSGDGPGGVHVVHGQAVPVCVHGELLAFLRGHGVNAVLVFQVPEQVVGGLDHLAVVQGHGGSGAVIGGLIRGGHGLAAGSIVNDVSAVGQDPGHIGAHFGGKGVAQLQGGGAVLGVNAHGSLHV